MTEESDHAEEAKKRLLERVIPVLIKRIVERAVESGVEKLIEGPENLRNLVADLKLPKDVLGDVYSQIDDTKNGLYRVVAKEVRDVIEQTHFADELTKVLTKLSLEVKTEIRFVPNDFAAKDGVESKDDDEGGAKGKHRKLPKPQVVADVKLRDRDKDRGDDRQSDGGAEKNRREDA